MSESQAMTYGAVAGVDKPVSRLVQGCTGISAARAEESFALLDGVYALGCNAFDTAHVYGGGDSERILGRWINERRLRDKVVVIDKGAHHSGDRKRTTPCDITVDLMDNLARLKTDHVDVWLLHRDDPDVPVGPIVETLNEHKAAGRIGAFGGSNWSARRIAEANEYAAAHGLTGFAASSPNLSLAVALDVPWDGCVSITGAAGAEDRRWYAESQLPVFSWSSLAGGFCTGRFTRDNVAAMAEGFDQRLCECYGSEENFARLDWAAGVAAEAGVEISQVALAWVFAQGMNVFALTACRTPEEMAHNIRALHLPLPDNAPA